MSERTLALFSKNEDSQIQCLKSLYKFELFYIIFSFNKFCLNILVFAKGLLSVC